MSVPHINEYSTKNINDWNFKQQSFSELAFGGLESSTLLALDGDLDVIALVGLDRLNNSNPLLNNNDPTGLPGVRSDISNIPLHNNNWKKPAPQRRGREYDYDGIVEHLENKGVLKKPRKKRLNYNIPNAKVEKRGFKQRTDESDTNIKHKSTKHKSKKSTTKKSSSTRKTSSKSKKSTNEDGEEITF